MRIYVFVGLLAVCSAQEVRAQELNYRLPQVTMVAGWQARITHCPNSEDNEFRYTTNVAVAAVASPGELVRLNPTSPFLGSRKVSLTFHENGMLKTINAEGQGQGGTILAGLLKSAASFAALGVPVPPPPPAVAPANTPSPTPAPPPHIVCRPEIEKAVARWHEVSDAIEAIESDILSGEALGSIRTALYEDFKKEQADLEEDLTLSTGVKLKRTRAEAVAKQGADGAYLEDQSVDPIDVGEWLVADSRSTLPTLKVGQHGFCASFSTSKASWDASVPTSTTGLKTWRREHVSGNVLNGGRLNRFVHLSPVPVTIEFWLRNTSMGGCLEDGVRGKKLTTKTVMVPQFSDYFILPLGSGVFESKATSAEFADDGRLVSIGTNNTGGGAQFAEALAGAVAAAETAQGAKTDAIQRKIDRIRAENELRGLLDASENK